MKNELQNNLQIVYTYFSNQMRNCTAAIATSVELLSHKMNPEDGDLYKEVIESAFLLDLMDKGMNICFQEIFSNSPNYSGTLNLEQGLMCFTGKLKYFMDERGIKLNLHVATPAVINGLVHEISTMIDIIIYEVIRQTDEIMTVKLINKKLTASTDRQIAAPPVWGLFKTMLNRFRVGFEYSKNRCTLEFSV